MNPNKPAIELNAMETLQISPNILRWAADQCGLSLDALVDLLEKPAKHDALVAGKFSIAEAEKLARKTHIPFGYFFLDTPPVTVQRGIPDLRQLPNHEPLSEESAKNQRKRQACLYKRSLTHDTRTNYRRNPANS